MRDNVNSVLFVTSEFIKGFGPRWPFFTGQILKGERCGERHAAKVTHDVTQTTAASRAEASAHGVPTLTTTPRSAPENSNLRFLILGRAS